MIGLYARVSTSEQNLNGHSIGEQQERLKNYCSAMGWKSFKLYVDGGFSGASMERPALKDLIEDVKKGKVEKVVVYKLDRLSRSQKDTLFLIEDVFLKNKCDFVSMNENFDTSTPLGRAMIGILSVFAQLEREQIRERVALGREGRAKEGKYHGGGWIPIGYDYQDGELIVNEYEAMQIKEIHRMYQSGNTFRGIARDLNARGLQNKNGHWMPARVKICLLNDLYIGKVHFNGETFQGTHAPIIDEETFKASVSLFESRDYSKCRNQGRSSYLGSLVYCKRCGARYGTSLTRKFKYYCCYSRRKSVPSMITDPTCMNKNYKQEDLDRIVFDEIRKLALDPSRITDIRQEDGAEKESLLLKEIEKIDSQKSRLMDLYSLGEFSIDEITSKIAPLSERKRKLEENIKEIRKAPLSVGEAVKKVSSFDEVLARGDFEEIRTIIMALIDRIDIDGDLVEIHWRFV